MKRLTIFSIALIALLLTACGPSAEENSAAVLTQAAQIFSDSLTQTAAVAPPTATATPVPPTSTNTPLPPTNTPTITGTPPTATASPTQKPSGGGSSGAGCLRAELTYETPKDGAQFDIDARFVKTWIFKNIGTCPWTPGFSVSFISGDIMGANSTVPFTDFTDVNILPGEHVTVKVTMIAPNEQGTYKGYWMLRSDGGILFGLGPDGQSWFWVEIYAKH